MKDNIYLAQFSLTITPGNLIFMPYAVASVWSYAQTFDDVKEKYEMKEIFFEKIEPDDVVASLDNPKVFAFGCYVWNCNYTDVIAQKVKEKYPECLIVYGGPHIPITANDKWWTQHHYVDVVVYYEGEKRFTRILQCSSKAEMSLISNVSVNLNSGWTFNLDYKAVGKDRINDLSLIPSPYLLGLFPNPKPNHIPLMETTRGCPYACTFCDLGALNHNKVYKTELTRIQDELDWLVEHKLGSFYYVDNNFGIFKERDDTIIDMVIESKRKHGYPKSFFVNWAKNHKEDFVYMAKKLYDADILQSLCLSLQSRNNEVLEVIKRKSMNINDLSFFTEKCKEVNLPYSTEMMLGNPGETVDSWKDGYLDVVSEGVSCDIYAVALLPGAELASEKSRKEHEIETEWVQFPGVANPKYRPVREYMEQIVATKYMNREEMAEMFKWTWCTRLGHEFNFTRELANYCEKHNIANLREFYDKFYEYIKNSNGILHQYYVDHLLFRTDNYEYTLALKNIGFRDSLSLDDRDLVKQDIKSFASQFNFNNELIEYNDAKMFRGDVRYPWRIKFNYDFVNDEEKEVEIEFTETGHGRATSTRDNLIQGAGSVSDDYKHKKRMICTRTDGIIVNS
jgi:putative methyltransferase